MSHAQRCYRYVFLIACLVAIESVAAGESFIHFDLPPSLSVQQQPETVSVSEMIVTCDLRLSSLIASPSVPRIDQWLVRCQLRDRDVTIVDYAPRTEVASNVDGSIQVKISDEQTDSIGLTFDGNYAKIAHGSIGADQATKKSESQQYNRVAPVQAVTASGTINRGRGVYFKLRWTERQVLEGEKSFKLTLRIPRDWRGSLIDVDVIAESQQRTFTPWDNHIKTLGAANFVVAVHRSHDAQAADLAKEIAESEQSLREILQQHQMQSAPQTLPAILRHVFAKLDPQSSDDQTNWIGRLLSGDVDPYIDKRINQLPMEIRVAAIDYRDACDRFSKLQPMKLQPKKLEAKKSEVQRVRVNELPFNQLRSQDEGSIEMGGEEFATSSL